MTAHRSLIFAVFLTLAAFVRGPVAAVPDPVLDFTGGAPSVFSNDATLGWKFTVGVGSPITIGALGVFDFGADGLVQSHDIGLWTSGGIPLASATITTANSTSFASTSSAGNWRSTPITPLALLPGDYVVGAFYAKNSPDWFMFIRNATPSPYPGTVSTLPGVTFDEPRSLGGSSLVFPTDCCVTIATAGFFGPNLFTVAAPPVPEPETYAMLMAGLGLLGFIARRRRKSLNAAA